METGQPQLLSPPATEQIIWTMTYQEESKPGGDRSMQDPEFVLAGTLGFRTALQTGRREWCQA
jgi:hypothetical protein